MSQILIKNIIRQLNELQEGSLWFDQNFREKIGNLSSAEAFSVPIPEVHSVAEHVSHMIEWRKECLLRFEGNKRELMYSPDDWKENDTLKVLGWDHLKNHLYDSTEALVQALISKEDSFLDITFQDTEYNNHYLIDGIIQHDLYHLGQIGITLKLINSRP